jgi:hypothetical protein
VNERTHTIQSQLIWYRHRATTVSLILQDHDLDGIPMPIVPIAVLIPLFNSRLLRVKAQPLQLMEIGSQDRQLRRQQGDAESKTELRKRNISLWQLTHSAHSPQATRISRTERQTYRRARGKKQISSTACFCSSRRKRETQATTVTNTSPSEHVHK